MSVLSIISASAHAAGVSPGLLLAVCFYESSFRADIVVAHDGGSPSFGVAQVKLSTAREILPSVTPALLLDPVINTVIAALYLKKQMRRCGDQWKGVDAYNRGHCYEHSNTKYVRKVKNIMKERPWLTVR